MVQEIINDIQQNNIGQLFDFDYLVSLTVQMNALLNQYSSQKTVFHVVGSNDDHNPTTMTIRDWHNVISLLWIALKSFITFSQQQEFNLVNDKFKVPKMKPLVSKDKKPVAAAKEKHPKAIICPLQQATQNVIEGGSGISNRSTLSASLTHRQSSSTIRQKD